MKKILQIMMALGLVLGFVTGCTTKDEDTKGEIVEVEDTKDKDETKDETKEDAKDKDEEGTKDEATEATDEGTEEVDTEAIHASNGFGAELAGVTADDMTHTVEADGIMGGIYKKGDSYIGIITVNDESFAGNEEATPEEAMAKLASISGLNLSGLKPVN